MPTHPATADLPRHMMGIWPHPDDEAYLSAGLMARMTDTGRRVTVLTLTRGEKGTSDPADFDQPHFAVRRERELRASLAEVGVDDVRVLDYRDGECELVDDEAAIGQIADQIDSVRPDVIITFGPDGITGHRDHRVVSAWVTEAWRRVGHGELLYATMSDEFVSRNADLHQRIGLFSERADDGPASYPTDQIALTCDLSDDELDRKRRALAHHGSQTRPLAALIGEDAYRTCGEPSGSGDPPPWKPRHPPSAYRLRRPRDARRRRSEHLLANHTHRPRGRPAARHPAAGARHITPIVIGVLPIGLTIGVAIAMHPITTDSTQVAIRSPCRSISPERTP